jgi:hypothetical protein
VSQLLGVKDEVVAIDLDCAADEWLRLYDPDSAALILRGMAATAANEDSDGRVYRAGDPEPDDPMEAIRTGRTHRTVMWGDAHDDEPAVYVDGVRR